MRAEAGDIHGLLQELSQIYFGLSARWHSFIHDRGRITISQSVIGNIIILGGKMVVLYAVMY